MDEDPRKFIRLNSRSSQICPSPEEELLEAVLNNYRSKIQSLIRRKESLLCHTYPEFEKRIFLIACSEESVEASTVEKLLELKVNPKEFTDDGWMGLHFAAQRTSYEVMKVLLKTNPSDINATTKHESNALHVLIRYGQTEHEDFEKCVKLLIENGGNPNQTDIKNHDAFFWAQKKGVLDVLENAIKEIKPNQQNNNNRSKSADFDHLLNYIKSEKEDEFVQYNNGNIKDYIDSKDFQPGLTLLQQCCEKGMTKAVKHLLSQGADPNKTGAKSSEKPIIIAANHGFSDILEILLSKYESIASVPEGVLAKILQNIDNIYHDHKGCYKVLMNKIKAEKNRDLISVKLNETDELSNNPLHYAIRYAPQETVHELLELGASLGSKNYFGNMPIKDIEPEVLEKHLDNCMIFDKSNRNNAKEEFQVTINYRSLIPPYVHLDKAFNNDEDGETTKISIASTGIEPVAETEVILYMSKTSEFKHLLKHPVIVSFLFMKWLRVQWLFWINLFFYIIFALSLGIYIFSDYAYFSSEEKSTIHTLIARLSYVCLLVTWFALIMRELFQISVDPKNYFQSFENYIEIVLIIITSLIVFVSSPSNDSKKQLSSISILLAAFELVLMLGQHPYFSTNVVMLRTVSFNFFKFLIWYSLLIVAFALSFYLLFSSGAQTHGKEVTNVTLSSSDDGDEDKSFHDPGRSVFKTIVMLTGEFDASDINFDTFPVTSKLIFVLFIFMIAIILLNLLNGLAVSDTQSIKNDAELVGHIARAQHIAYVESMLIGNILPTNFLNKINDLCCCLPATKNLNYPIGKSWARNACLFPKYLNYELTVFPNKNGHILLNSKSKSCVPCKEICLDKDTVRRINKIVQRKKEETNWEMDIADLKRQIITILNKMEPQIGQIGHSQ